MRFKTKILKEALDWVTKHWKQNRCYNLSMMEIRMTNSGFTDKQLEQLGKILTEALAPIKKDIVEIRKDIAEIKSLPTIQRELKQKSLESQ